MPEDYHPYTWLLWLTAGTIAALLARNPLYLAIVLVAAAFVFAALLRRQSVGDAAAAAHARPRTWKPVLQLALFLWIFNILFNALTVHQGQIILFTLPRTWPIIGGPITLEAVIFGFVTGLSFVTLIFVFTVFNSAVGPQTLLRLVPAFAHHAGVALTIAVSFIPQTVIAWQDIREAQRLRGHKVRGLRDLRPLFISLLSIGLDRAIQLAESMDARGFGGNVTPLPDRERRFVRVGAVVGLLLLLAGLILRSFAGQPWWGLGLMLGGGLLLILTFRLQGRRLHRSRYRRWIWRRRDSLVSVAAGILLIATLAVSLFAADQFFYYPYPPYDLIPAFQPFLGLLYTLLLAPAILLPPVKSRQSDRATQRYDEGVA